MIKGLLLLLHYYLCRKDEKVFRVIVPIVLGLLLLFDILSFANVMFQDPFESNLFPTIVDVEDGNHFYFFLLNMVAPIINSFINGSFFFASIVMAIFIKPKNYQQFTPFENYKDYSDFHSQDTISSNEKVNKDQPYEL